MLTRVAVLVVLGITSTRAFFFTTDHSVWDDLKLTWGINPFSSYNYNSQPRTEDAARDAGWVELVSGASCASNSNFKGKRFINGNDMAAILIYDVNGYIAGLQAGFPQNYPGNTNNYPSSHITPHPLVLDGGNYYITAYFVDPSTICTTGRSAAQYHSQGTGSGLWIQNGTNPITDSTMIPHRQTDVERTMWTRGKCFKTMGMHYWYNQSASMSCDKAFPMFLLYNGGVLNGFGWAFGINLKGSSVYEHPPRGAYSMFMRNEPTCLARWGTLTTLHIYMDSHYLLNRC